VHALATDKGTAEVQVFGTKKSAETRKALRFFSERRVKTHFVDFSEHGPALAELRRFAAKFGLVALIDRASRRFSDLGLAHAIHSDTWWEDKLQQEPLLLRMPLVRYGRELTMGLDEPAWQRWLEPS
jgi:arsenate reductase-like glutaredoxin family protein